MFEEVPIDAFTEFNLSTVPLHPRLHRTYKVVCKNCLNITSSLIRNDLSSCFTCINSIMISKHVKSFLVRRNIHKLTFIEKWCWKKNTYLPHILHAIFQFLV